VCAGIHWRTTLFWCLLIRLCRLQLKCVISLLVSVPFSSASSVERLCVKIMTSVIARGLVKKVEVNVFYCVCDGVLFCDVVGAERPTKIENFLLSPSGKLITAPYPALIVALNADPSVYEWIHDVGKESIVSSAEALSAMG